MNFIRLACVLLMVITCGYTSPIQVNNPTATTISTTETSKQLKPTPKRFTPTVIIASIKTNQETKSTNSNNLLTRIGSSNNMLNSSKTDTLYQVANNLLQKEKNWLQTEKWLIDNVYRLRNELGDIKRELSDQKKLNLLLSQKTVSSAQQFSNEQIKNVNLIQDISSLRADHSLIAQQQQQIIQTTKENQQQLHGQTDLLRQLTTMVKEQFKSVASISQAVVSLQQINDSQLNGNTNQLISKLMYDLSALSSTSSSTAEKLSVDADKAKINRIQQRSINPKILKFLQTESQFEGHAEHKVGQLSQEIHSLHSMTINLSKELADLQKKVIKPTNEKK